MNRIACLAGFIVLCSFNTPAQAFAGGPPFVGNKVVVTHHHPVRFVHNPYFFAPTPVVHRTFVTRPYVTPFGYVYQPAYVFPHQHFGVIHHGVPFGGHGVIVVK